MRDETTTRSNASVNNNTPPNPNSSILEVCMEV